MNNLENGNFDTTAAGEKNIPLNPKTSTVEKLEGEMPSAAGLIEFANRFGFDVDSLSGRTDTNKKIDLVDSSFVTNDEVEYSIQIPRAPLIENGRTLVPLRAVTEALGCQVDWNGEGQTQTATITKDGKTVVFSKDKNSSTYNKTITVDGVNKILDVSGKIIDGSTVLPLRAISEIFDYGVDWYSNNQEITILEPIVSGKVLVLRIGSNEIKVSQNTYEGRLRRAVYFLSGDDRQRIIDLIESDIGPVEPPVSMTDAKSGAQINFINEDYSNQFETEEAMTADFNAKFGKFKLNKEDTVYVYPNRLVVFTGTNKNNVRIYTNSPNNSQQVVSNSDFIISYSNDELIVGNNEGSIYNLNAEKWKVDVTKTPEFATAKQTVVDHLNHYNSEDILTNNNNKDVSNIYGIDKSEIDKYAQTGSCEGLKSFQVLNYIDVNGNELPGLIMVTGGEYGLKQYATEMKQGIDWLNTIDPSLVRSLVKDTYAITGNSVRDMWAKTHQNYWSSYVTSLNTVFFHESYLKDNKIIKSPYDMAILFYLEADSIRLERNGGAPINSEKQKRADILVWLEQNKNIIPPAAYNWRKFCLAPVGN